ncbi:hypothetical protein GCM10010924_45980 [Rhizobium wenxiniae]|nr:hypothetical protein GCM10010924_45980 [Rhizobium wenxiniae]
MRSLQFGSPAIRDRSRDKYRDHEQRQSPCKRPQECFGSVHPSFLPKKVCDSILEQATFNNAGDTTGPLGKSEGSKQRGERCASI